MRMGHICHGWDETVKALRAVTSVLGCFTISPHSPRTTPLVNTV